MVTMRGCKIVETPHERRSSRREEAPINFGFQISDFEKPASLRRRLRAPRNIQASTMTKKFRYMSGRARHSVCAADSNPFAERRARSDAPYPASLATGGSFGM